MLIDNFLKGDKEAEIDRISKSDVDLLISLAQDYVATQQLIDQSKPTNISKLNIVP